MRVIDGGLTFSAAASSPIDQRAAAVERAEHGELVEREVVAAALEAQPAGQPHHADAQRAGERGISDEHIVSLAHYLC